MKRKQGLCMALCAFAGLSACQQNVALHKTASHETSEATTFCVPGEARCAGDMHQTCNEDDSAYDDINCPGDFPSRPHCDATDVCVQCAKDNDCTADQCDTVTHTCVVPAITWCHSQTIDATAQISHGQVLDPRSVKDAASIEGMILCGTAEQSIGEYVMFMGALTPDCADCDDKFAYSAVLSLLPAGDYLCMWVFTIVDGPLTACQTNGTALVADRSLVPTVDNALSYTVAP